MDCEICLQRRHFIEGRADDFDDSQFEEKRMACQKKCASIPTGERIAADQARCGFSEGASKRRPNGLAWSGSINRAIG